MRTWKDVATLVKTRNLKGRFVARYAADFPFSLQEGVEVAFVPPQTDLPRRGVVTFSHEVDDSTFEVEFDTVQDEHDAHGLVGCHCLIRRDEIDESLYEDEPATWEGWEVVDEDGAFIGFVKDVADNPGQALLEVERPDGVGTAYIPVVDEIIIGVDVPGSVITVCLPKGLLDL